MAQIQNSLPAGPTSETQLVEFEKYIGHQLPIDYRQFLLSHNGGKPEPDAFLFVNEFDEQEEDIVECFFPMRDLKLGTVHVEQFEELHTWPVHCAWDDLQNDLQNLYEVDLEAPLLPIGTDGSSNYFCIVLAGDRAGAIDFLEHEWGRVSPLAKSFNDFLASLKPRERTDYA